MVCSDIGGLPESGFEIKGKKAVAHTCSSPFICIHFVSKSSMALFLDIDAIHQCGSCFHTFNVLSEKIFYFFHFVTLSFYFKKNKSFSFHFDYPISMIDRHQEENPFSKVFNFTHNCLVFMFYNTKVRLLFE